jgi:hypothetical protein
MAWLVLEDCIRILWPGENAVTGWEADPEQPKPAKRSRDTVPAAVVAVPQEAAHTAAANEEATCTTNM